ncbi:MULTISPECIES: hypothetical protein [Pseudomonas]|uniref:hypothetical protein n=1 Tax=Pseudomonas TaxID=286 RepID=UPI001F395861|nr:MULTISPECIES: hypothetical protein [Pseudomonas]UUC53578.1 hypothetical protein NOX82_10670 [Pseudomonas citronellolis]
MSDCVRFEVDGAFLDLPVHASFPLPDFQRLFRGETTAQAMPGSFADIGHTFDEMSHDEFPVSNSRHKALREAQHRRKE